METIEPKDWERIAQILCDNITFSGQVGDYVIHGAIDKIQEEFIEPLRKENEYLKESLSQMMNQDWAAMQEAGTLEMVATISKLEAENKEMKERLNKFIQNTTEWS